MLSFASCFPRGERDGTRGPWFMFLKETVRKKRYIYPQK